MKIDLVDSAFCAALLRMPPRRRLVPRSSYPGVSRVWVSPDPLRRLASFFGFGRSH